MFSIAAAVLAPAGAAEPDDARARAIQAARSYLATQPDHPMAQLLDDPNTDWSEVPSIEVGDAVVQLAPLEVELVNLGASLLAGRDRANLLKLYEALSKSFDEAGDFPSVDDVAKLPTNGIWNITAHLMDMIDRNLWDISDYLLLQDLVYNPIASCSSELGFENGGTSGETSARCTVGAYSANGLMGNVDFPLKDNLTCIKDQGTRGTCVAHAIAAAVETTAMVNGGGAENLSEQDVYYEAKTQVPGQFDPFQDGLYTDLTLSHLDSTAYPFQYEEAWNYNRSPNRIGPIFAPGPLFFGSCDAGYLGELCTDLAFQGTQIPVPGLLVTLRPPVPSVGAHEITTAVNLPVGAPFNIDATLGTIAGFVSIDVPIIVSFTVTNTFNFPDVDGYVRNIALNPPIGGHAALIVGFVPDSALPAGVVPALQEGFFIIKNSWGTGAADCGFYYVDWSYLRTYASGFAFVEVN